ncbi:MAG TPA: hypothetical protein VMR43_05840 [Variovorax sp.]|nr:hypothetical protein [Variovorax sp.]
MPQETALGRPLSHDEPAHEVDDLSADDGRHRIGHMAHGRTHVAVLALGEPDHEDGEANAHADDQQAVGEDHDAHESGHRRTP